MPTSVTFGKCSPFAIICVPTRISILPGAKGVQRFLERILARDGIGIQPPHHRAREKGAHQFLHFFRARAGVADARVGALRALGRHHGDVAADVAVQAIGRAVKRERQRAVRAFAHVAAGRADEGGGEAAAVQEKDRLLLLFQPGAHGLAERLGKDAGPLAARPFHAACR